jgi:hypothetical protein
MPERMWEDQQSGDPGAHSHVSLKNCYMPFLYQQSNTPPLPKATWGMRILVVWNKAAREQLITNKSSWLKK